MDIRRKVAAATLAIGLSFVMAAAPAMAKGGNSGGSSSPSGKCKVVGVDAVTGANILNCARP